MIVYYTFPSLCQNNRFNQDLRQFWDASGHLKLNKGLNKEIIHKNINVYSII